MTALSLDLRRPVAVLLGAFNPAIFSPGWIANHFFDIPEGSDLRVVEAVLQMDRQFLALTFVEGIALNVTLERLEIYAANTNALVVVETVLSRIMEVLPHTPIMAIGCNFSWVDIDPAAAVADLFDSPEGFEGLHKVLARQYSVAIDLEDATLNFVRAATESAVNFNFNFHRNVENSEACLALVAGLVHGELERSKEMMKKFYGYEDYKTEGLTIAENQGEGSDATETSH